MEVHHPHSHKGPKKIKEYFFEGLMIFIAVTLGYAAENLREHAVETKKAVKSVRNLYKDVLADSAKFQSSVDARNRQDSCFRLVDDLYQKNLLQDSIALLYQAHKYMSYRQLPIINTLALEQIKNTGIINFIEDDSLKTMIQIYDQDGRNLLLRENREFGYIDRMVDPITSKYFRFKYYSIINERTQVVENGKLVLKIKLPSNIDLHRPEELDWQTYISTMGFLSTIRLSSDFNYIKPANDNCLKLLRLIRNYLSENGGIEAL